MYLESFGVLFKEMFEGRGRNLDWLGGLGSKGGFFWLVVSSCWRVLSEVSYN